MRGMRAAFAALGAVLVMAQAAPSPSPIMAHYRAYRAAMDAGDIATAETEAAAALEASVTRDGDGGRTGVLALNLAQVRLQRGRIAEANAPALQAQRIAATRADSGVDPLLARLVVGRSMLTSGAGRSAGANLETTLQEARSRTDLTDEAYFAAADLGRFYANENLFVSSAESWAIAAALADPNQPEHRVAYAEARLGEGIARYSEIVRSQDQRRTRPSDTTIRLQTDRYAEADAAFAEAERILAPLAYVDGGGMNLTPAQSMYSLTRSWRNVLYSFLFSTGQQNIVAGQRYAERAIAYQIPVQASAPICDFTVNADPRPHFPADAEQRVVVGAVDVRMLLTPDGRVEDIRVSGAVPQQWFREEVEAVMDRWTVTRADSSAPNCVFPRVLFYSFSFRYR